MTAAERARQLERQLAEAVQEIKSGIAGDVAGAEIPGVRRLSPCAIVVKSSMIGESWHPEYWNGEAQKRRVLEKIDGANTLDALSKRLKALLDDRQAQFHPVFRSVLQAAYDDIMNA